MAIALVGVFLVVVHLSEVRRSNVIERARLQVLTDVIANDIAVNLSATNHALERVILDHLNPAGPVSRPLDISRRLRALEEAMPGIRSLTVLDADGIVIAASSQARVGQSFRARDYFKTVLARPDKATLYVSAPFISIMDDLVITAARMVPGADGRFAGMIVATLDPEYFTGILRPAIYAPDVWGYIVHGDGVQLLNFPVIKGIDGTDLGKPGTFFTRHRESGQANSMLTGAIYTTGERRLMALRTVQPAALSMDRAIVVGISRAEAAIAWPLQRQGMIYGAFYAALVLLCYGGLHMTQKRRAHMEAIDAASSRERLEADERMRVALKGANLALWSLRVPSRAWSFDENCFVNLGYSPDDIRDDPDFFYNHILPEDLPAYRAALGACIDGSSPFFEVTFRIRHGNRSWVWVLARAQAIERDGEGRAITVLGTYLNVTALKTAEQEVVRTRNELLAIFDNMAEAVFVFSESHEIIRVNRAGQSMLGLFDPATPIAALMGNIELRLPTGEPIPGEQWPSRRGLRGHFVRDHEIEVRRKDTGAAVSVAVATTPILDESGQVDLLILTVSDISERRLGRALRESEARFRTLIEDAPVAIAILRRGLFVYSNPRYRALHGYLTAEDLAGRPWSDLIAGESRLALRDNEALIVEDSPTEQMFEAQGLGAGGRAMPVFTTTARVELAEGPATLVFVQDISAQKLAESSLLEARDTAETANRSKAEFLANMSHEIRSPLNAILGLAYILEQARLEPDARNVVGKIRTSGRMLLGIINDILDVSKIDAGQMAIERAPFRLDDVIDSLASSMGIAVGGKDIQLIIQPSPAGVGALIGDALRLEQVLVNLTSNAIKFTHAGQVELRIALLSRHEEKIVLRFAVRDTGIGIAPELQNDVFSPFTQADSSTTRRFGGTGLGLTICRQLIGLMGGEIGLTSNLGQGSEFWFTLPLQQIADAGFSSPDMVGIDALIADDSDIALRAVGDIAESLGWGVTAVSSGAAVLSHVMERKDGQLPNVVVLDWKMPGMDGLATARAIRECVPEAQCPIVIMASAYSLSTLADQPDAGVADAILNKPITASSLYNAVIEAQRRRAAAVGVAHAPPKAASRALTGIRVLVVDDSDINCEVAQQILLEQGAVVQLACDGKAALDWLLAHPADVDLVLMDVQMPVMDGIEATRRLRELPQFSDLPIVALTSGAFKSQQEAAYAAGMTHFISKPFDVISTIAAIQRLSRKRPNAPAAVHVIPQAPQPAPERPADLCVIDIGQGLQLWTKASTYRDYLKRFVRDYGDAVDAMNARLAANDRAGAAALAHKLAGVAGNMALPDTNRLAVEAERMLANGYDATRALDRLADALALAIAAIGRFAPSVADDAAPAFPGMLPATQAELESLLNEVMTTLDTDNPTLFETIVPRLSALLPRQGFAEIIEHVRNFDFRGAEVSTVRLATAHGITLKE